MQIALNAATVVLVGRAMMILEPSLLVAAIALPTLMSDSLASDLADAAGVVVGEAPAAADVEVPAPAAVGPGHGGIVGRCGLRTGGQCDRPGADSAHSQQAATADPGQARQ